MLLDKVQNRAARVRQHRWRTQPWRSRERHIVIGGSPRSGTTFFRRCLDRHPSIAAGGDAGIPLPGQVVFGRLEARSGVPAPELEAMRNSSRSQAEFVDRFAARVRATRGKPRWAEKTPLNVLHFGWALDHFPEARLVHLIRDGRDV